jgi:hypothetical protein
MSAIQEAEKALDDFIEKYDHCVNCGFWTPELIGGVCDGPELQIGYMEDDTSTCEQLVFRDTAIQERLETLQKKWLDAWQIVEGFIYTNAPEGTWV